MLGLGKRAPNETAKFRNAVKNYIDTFVLGWQKISDVPYKILLVVLF